MFWVSEVQIWREIYNGGGMDKNEKKKIVMNIFLDYSNPIPIKSDHF